MNFYTFFNLHFIYYGTYRYVKNSYRRDLYFSGFTFYPSYTQPANHHKIHYVTDMLMNPARTRKERFKKANIDAIPKIYRDYFNSTAWLLEMYGGSEHLGREFTI